MPRLSQFGRVGGSRAELFRASHGVMSVAVLMKPRSRDGNKPETKPNWYHHFRKNRTKSEHEKRGFFPISTSACSRRHRTPSDEPDEQRRPVRTGVVTGTTNNPAWMSRQAGSASRRVASSSPRADHHHSTPSRRTSGEVSHTGLLSVASSKYVMPNATLHSLFSLLL